MEKFQSLFYYTLEEVDITESTNNYIRHIPLPPGIDLMVVTANYQTAGKGQGTNKWESERGKNLLFSIKCQPYKVEAFRQFVLMQTISLALYRAICKLLGNYEDIKIKWPNDIYYKDKKLCGTLSECTLRLGFVHEFIAGVGLNVNQLMFISDAPNPVSLAGIKGHSFDRHDVLEKIIKEVSHCFKELCEWRGYLRIPEEYEKYLYRKEGLYKYKDANGVFMAEFDRTLFNGHLILRRTDGTMSEYEFKEVSFLL